MTATKHIIGLDEVGRGCWAGPLVAAAVVLAEDIPGLNDSKRLSAKSRTELDTLIRQQAVAHGIGWVWPTDIDTHGLTWAVTSAMTQAMEHLTASWNRPAEIIIDGSYNFLKYYTTDWPIQTIIKADGLIPSVSAASIIAKVARDNYMAERAIQYPAYGFDKHVGYGTAAHIKALHEHGITPLHRKSYKPIQKILLQSAA